jgi:hypothetical protein
MPLRYSHGTNCSIDFARRRYGGRIRLVKRKRLPSAHRVHPPVVHPRLADLDRAQPGQHLARRQVAVADHQPVPAVVEALPVPLDVLGDLPLDGPLQHRPRALAQHVIQHRGRGRCHPQRLRYSLHHRRIPSPVWETVSF